MPARKVWTRERILDSLREFERETGRAPRVTEFRQALPDRPNSDAVVEAFNGWDRALAAAGLAHPGRWHDDEAILRALRADSKRRGRPTAYNDWLRGCRSHPCSATVVKRFGAWRNALAAADLAPRGREHPWTVEEVLDSLRAWATDAGRWPREVDWKVPGMSPGTKTIVRLCGSFNRAVELAKAPATSEASSEAPDTALRREVEGLIAAAFDGEKPAAERLAGLIEGLQELGQEVSS